MPPASRAKIKCQCDNCQKIEEISYCNYTHRKRMDLGDFCKNCAVLIKLPQILNENYGVSNCASLDFVQDKKKKTNLDKYGNEWAIASSTVREKIVESIIQKFGVDNPMKNIEVQNKAKDTNNKRYGGNSPLCNEEIKAKSRKTSINKYGVSNPYQCKEIQAKAKQTLYKNQTNPSSKVEKKLCVLLQEMFGEQNCFPSYPLDNLTLDCLLTIDNCLIDVEYDGYYWHQNRGQKDAARNAILLDLGYKILRIKGNNQDILPTTQQIQNAIDDLIKNNHHLVFINMNN